jgi:hypothetical protein
VIGFNKGVPFLLALGWCLVLLPFDHLIAQNPQAPSTHEMVKAFVRNELRRDGGQPERTARFSYALIDLNGDGMREAIVRIVDSQVCGSGGCSMYILRRQGSRYRVVNWTSITRPPIRVLTTRSHGWRDISVFVQGGGIIRGYEARLPFDGKAYPLNPTMPPARRLRQPIGGQILISRSSREYSL